MDRVLLMRMNPRSFRGALVTLSLWSSLAAAGGKTVAPVRLQALLPTSGANAAALLLGQPGSGWKPEGDPRDEGVLFRFEDDVAIDRVKIIACPGSDELEVAVSVNGGGPLRTLTFGEKREGMLEIPAGEKGPSVRSLFARITSASGAACLYRVVFESKGRPLAIEAPRMVPGRVQASSVLTPAEAYEPSYAFDGRLDFGWVEGAKGLGVGESLTVAFQKPTAMTGFQIWNGYQRSPDHFRKNARAKRLQVFADGQPVGAYDLKDAMGPISVPFGKTVTAKELRFAIEQATPGTKYEDLVISELRFLDSAGPFTLQLEDAKQRADALRAQLAHKPLESVLNRQLTNFCEDDDEGGSSRSLKLRTSYDFVWYVTSEEGNSHSEEVFDGVWIPHQSGTWSELELYGRRHRTELRWEPYEAAKTKQTDRIAGGKLSVARVSDLGPKAFWELVKQWRGGPAANSVWCLYPDSDERDESYKTLLQRNAVVVRGTAITDLLATPARER